MPSLMLRRERPEKSGQMRMEQKSQLDTPIVTVRMGILLTLVKAVSSHMVKSFALCIVPLT